MYRISYKTCSKRQSVQAKAYFKRSDWLSAIYSPSSVRTTVGPSPISHLICTSPLYFSETMPLTCNVTLYLADKEIKRGHLPIIRGGFRGEFCWEWRWFSCVGSRSTRGHPNCNRMRAPALETSNLLIQPTDFVKRTSPSRGILIAWKKRSKTLG